jgi:branched-subunit amino acid transport protein
MTDATLWALFVAMGLVTLAARASFVLLQDRARPPAQLRRALHYVPPAVLAAIVAPELAAPGTTAFVGPVDPRLPSALLAAVVAWRTGSVLATFSVGMASLWSLTWLIGLA